MRFPLFIDIKDKRVLVVGGGKIAARRVDTLLNFGANITVIAPRSSINTSGITYIERPFTDSDIDNYFMVIAATDNRIINHHIYELCRQKNILVNTADCKDECDFYFPAVCIKDNLVVGVVSGGNNHSLVKDVAQKIRRLLNG